MLGPGQHHEEIGVGDREFVTGDEWPAGEFLLQIAEALANFRQGVRLHLIGRRAEQWSESLMDLAIDEGEPLLELVAREGAVGGREAAGRPLIGEILNNRRP